MDDNRLAEIPKNEKLNVSPGHLDDLQNVVRKLDINNVTKENRYSE